MPKTIETTVFEYEELSDTAKAKARDWYREGGFDYDWYSGIYDDFHSIAASLDINLVKKQPIEFSGFYSQGDGARFSGHWSHGEGNTIEYVGKIKAYAPTDEKLAEIATGLQTIMQKYDGQVFTSIVPNDHHYCHKFATRITAELQNNDAIEAADEEEIARLMRCLMQWLYDALESEWEGITGDDAVADTIKCNDYTFTESGARFG